MLSGFEDKLWIQLLRTDGRPDKVVQRWVHVAEHINGKNIVRLKQGRIVAFNTKLK